MFLIFLRSLVFNVLFYAVLVCLAIVALPTFALPPRAMLTVAEWWAKATLVLMRVVCNIKVEFRGTEKIPQGPLVIVAKHQSFWETFVLPGFFVRPIFILTLRFHSAPLPAIRGSPIVAARRAPWQVLQRENRLPDRAPERCPIAAKPFEDSVVEVGPIRRERGCLCNQPVRTAVGAV